MRIAMIGGGYVGLVSGACFAEFGNQVIIVERDLEKLAILRAQQVPIFEPTLDDVVRGNVDASRLAFTSDLRHAVQTAEIVFIAVGTPTRRGGGHADLTAVYEAARAIAEAASGPLIVVTKSTVPVGTGREVKRILQQARPDLVFDVASNPEFLREGNAVADFMNPDRVVIGVDAQDQSRYQHVTDIMKVVYRPLYDRNICFQFTSLESAELAKYASNGFLAMKVAFINEMADLCEKTGADILEVAACMGCDTRIGRDYLNAGPGFGGSCFPKDTRALAAIAQDAGAPSRLVEATITANEYRKDTLARKIVAVAGGSLEGYTICVLGLTFKPDTDDMREATSLRLIENLVTYGANVQAFDPEGMSQARELLGDRVSFAHDALTALSGSDITVLLTEWASLRALKPSEVLGAMRGRVVFDMRNAWDRALYRDAGAEFYAVGRKLPDKSPRSTLRASS